MASIRSVFSLHSLRGSSHGFGYGDSRSSPLRSTRAPVPNKMDSSVHSKRSQAPLATMHSDGSEVHAMSPWKSEEEEEADSIVRAHDGFASGKEEV